MAGGGGDMRRRGEEEGVVRWGEKWFEEKTVSHLVLIII